MTPEEIKKKLINDTDLVEISGEVSYIFKKHDMAVVEILALLSSMYIRAVEVLSEDTPLSEDMKVEIIKKLQNHIDNGVKTALKVGKNND